MKIYNLSTIYSKINKQISLVEAYTDLPGFANIIKACRLKPCDYVFGSKNSNIILQNWWFDEYSNSLKLVNKKIKITYNDLKLNKSNIINTDLYSGLSIDNVIKISKLIYICAGIDEEFYQPCYHITFLGIDNYLRSYLYMYGSLNKIAPLTLGIPNLKLLNDHKDIKYFSNFSNKKINPIPCLQPETWISCLPVHNNFMQEIKIKHNIIYNLLKENVY